MFQNYSCVVQYVIFPPHSSTGSSNMSTWSEEDNFDTASTLSSVDKNSVTEDESVQIISEVWIEPQDGVVRKEVCKSLTKILNKIYKNLYFSKKHFRVTSGTKWLGSLLIVCLRLFFLKTTKSYHAF